MKKNISRMFLAVFMVVTFLCCLNMTAFAAVDDDSVFTDVGGALVATGNGMDSYVEVVVTDAEMTDINAGDKLVVGIDPDIVDNMFSEAEQEHLVGLVGGGSMAVLDENDNEKVVHGTADINHNNIPLDGDTDDDGSITTYVTQFFDKTGLSGVMVAEGQNQEHDLILKTQLANPGEGEDKDPLITYIQKDQIKDEGSCYSISFSFDSIRDWIFALVKHTVSVDYNLREIKNPAELSQHVNEDINLLSQRLPSGTGTMFNIPDGSAKLWVGGTNKTMDLEEIQNSFKETFPHDPNGSYEDDCREEYRSESMFYDPMVYCGELVNYGYGWMPNLNLYPNGVHNYFTEEQAKEYLKDIDPKAFYTQAAKDALSALKENADDSKKDELVQALLDASGYDSAKHLYEFYYNYNPTAAGDDNDKWYWLDVIDAPVHILQTGRGFDEDPDGFIGYNAEANNGEGAWGFACCWGGVQYGREFEDYFEKTTLANLKTAFLNAYPAPDGVDPDDYINGLIASGMLDYGTYRDSGRTYHYYDYYLPSYFYVYTFDHADLTADDIHFELANGMNYMPGGSKNFTKDEVNVYFIDEDGQKVFLNDYDFVDNLMSGASDDGTITICVGGIYKTITLPEWAPTFYFNPYTVGDLIEDGYYSDFLFNENGNVSVKVDFAMDANNADNNAIYVTAEPNADGKFEPLTMKFGTSLFTHLNYAGVRTFSLTMGNEEVAIAYLEVAELMEKYNGAEFVMNFEPAADGLKVTATIFDKLGQQIDVTSELNIKVTTK